MTLETKIKILATADLHIHNWTAYSTYDERGVPSRLNVYLDLAECLRDLARSKNVDAVVIAGDVFQTPTPKPMVANIAREFVSIVAQCGAPLVITTGQHDCDTKSQNDNPLHTVVRSTEIDGLDNIHYVYAPETLELAGCQFAVTPWRSKQYQIDKLPSGDVFIGHGIVSGSTDLHGYKFLNGFNAGLLNEKYRLSIIGDMHKAQTFLDSASGNATLVPGAPVQNTWKDAPDCGVWIAEVGDGVKLDFFKSRDLLPGKLHSFLYVDEMEESEDELVHFKRSATAIALASEGAADKLAVEDEGLPDLMQVVESLLDVAPKQRDLLMEIVLEAYEAVDELDVAPPRSFAPLSILIQNFLSINEFYLDFERLPRDVALIGENGSGKTSLVEAFFWCLTGRFTKTIDAGDISNKFTKGAPSVKLKFMSGDDVYEIARGRDGGAYLHLAKLDLESGSLARMDGASMRETQEMVYNLVGISESDILVFSYFSTNALRAFGNLGGADKNALLGRLSGADILDSLREACKVKRDSMVADFHEVSGEVSALECQLAMKRDEKTKGEASLAMNKEDRSEIDRQASAVLSADAGSLPLSDLRLALNEELERANAGIDLNAEQEYRRLSDLEKDKIMEWKTANEAMNRCGKSIKELEGMISEARETGNCPLCKQPISNADDEVVKGCLEKLDAAQREMDANQEAKRRLEDEGPRVKREKERVQECLDRNAELSERRNKIVSIASLIEREESRTGNNLLRDRLARLDEEIASLEEQLAPLEVRRDDLSTRKGLCEWLVKTHLARNGVVMQKLNSLACNSIVAELGMIAPRDMIEFSLTSGKNTEVKARFKGRNQYVKIGEMSGGERRIVDILLMVALSNMFSKKHRLSKGVLGLAVFDEVFTYLDEKHMDLAASALAQLNASTRLIISHDLRLQSMFDRVILVRNDNGVSEYQQSF